MICWRLENCREDVANEKSCGFLEKSGKQKTAEKNLKVKCGMTIYKTAVLIGFYNSDAYDEHVDDYHKSY